MFKSRVLRVSLILFFSLCQYVFANEEDNYSNKKDELELVPEVRSKVVIEAFGDDDIVSINPLYGDSFSINNPIYFLSEGIKTDNYRITSDFCSFINSTSNLDCIVYPVESKSQISSYIRRGTDSQNYEKSGYNGDFLIVRADALKRYQQKQGYLKDAPYLDLVMFLNGEYLFMVANKSNNIFSLEQLALSKRNVRIGFLDKRGEIFFKRFVAPSIPNLGSVRYSSFVKTEANVDNLEKAMCVPGTVDVFISFGFDFSNNAKEAMSRCLNQLNAVSISEESINNILTSNDLLSGVNTISYYSTSLILNQIEIFINLQQQYQQLSSGKSSLLKRSEANKAPQNAQSKDDAAKTNVSPVIQLDSTIDRSSLSRQLPKARENLSTKSSSELSQEQKEKIESDASVADQKAQNERINQDQLYQSLRKDIYSNYVNKNNRLVFRQLNLDEVEGRSNKEFYFQDTETFREAPDKVFISENSAVRSVGLRYALVVSRYTKKSSIMDLFNAVIIDYFDIRNNFLSADMSKYTIRDLILGTSVKHNFVYHPFLASYPRYMLEQKITRSTEQSLAIRTINNTLDESNYPSFYGPPSPNNSQLDTIYVKVRDINRRKDELIVIRKYQKDLESINKALLDLRSGNEINNSLLETTGTNDTSLIFNERNVVTFDIEVDQEQANPEDEVSVEEESDLVVIDENTEVDPESEVGTEVALNEGEQVEDTQNQENPESAATPEISATEETTQQQ